MQKSTIFYDKKKSEFGGNVLFSLPIFIPLFYLIFLSPTVSASKVTLI